MIKSAHFGLQLSNKQKSYFDFLVNILPLGEK